MQRRRGTVSGLLDNRHAVVPDSRGMMFKDVFDIH